METIKGLKAIQKQVGKVLLEVPKSMANEVVELELGIKLINSESPLIQKRESV